jgi:hypothetical protein
MKMFGLSVGSNFVESSREGYRAFFAKVGSNRVGRFFLGGKVSSGWSAWAHYCGEGGGRV